MASNTMGDLQVGTVRRGDLAERSLKQVLRTAIAPLASLRLTVVLFALAIFLIFAGTLAQVDKDIWEVMNLYFRCWMAWVPLQIFFPKVFFPTLDPISGGFYFPGGFLLGLLMSINLLAAHAVRFTVQARGTRLLAGVLVIALGAALGWLVVMGGSDKEVVEGSAGINSNLLWWSVKAALAGLWLLALKALWSTKPGHRLERWGLGIAGVLLGGVLGLLLYFGAATTPDPSGMRILFQLGKATSVSLLLLAGCVLAFRKRAGIVLLHAGVGMMMVNELVVYSLHSEGLMRIQENHTTNFVEDIRAIELAFVEPVGEDEEDATVVPKRLLVDSRDADSEIKSADLPGNLRVKKYFPNSALRDAGPHEPNLATVGEGLKSIADERRPGSGVESGKEVDLPAAYVELDDKSTGKSLGTWLVSAELLPQRVEIGGRTYELALRFKRDYEPFSLTLVDVRKDDYLGTDKPRNYSSDVQLVDLERKVDRKVHIWMNNPLRYAGQTFYQSNYGKIGNTEVTTLQVVKNTGWMIPYLGCMMVVVGLVAQFGQTLVRFLRRRNDELIDFGWRNPAVFAAFGVAGIVGLAIMLLTGRRSDKVNPATDIENGASRLSQGKQRRRALAAQREVVRRPGWALFAVPAIAVLAAGSWLASLAREPKPQPDEFHFYEFGKLPIVYEGRVKPVDTLARNSLQMLSGRQSYVDLTQVHTDEKGHGEFKLSSPAAGPQRPELKKAPAVGTKVTVGKLTGKFAADTSDHGDGATVLIAELAAPSGKAHATVRYDGRKDLKAKEPWLTVTIADAEADKSFEVTIGGVPLGLGRQPASRWLLDVVSGAPTALEDRVFRITNPEVLETLHLEPRDGLLYSIDDIRPQLAELIKQVKAAHEIDPHTLSIYQKKLFDLDKKLRHYGMLLEAFQRPQLRRDHEMEDLLASRERLQQLATMKVPLAVPPEAGEDNWEPFAVGVTKAYALDLLRSAGHAVDKTPNPATVDWERMLSAYRRHDIGEFDTALANYRAELEAVPPPPMNGAKIDFEAFFNHFEPFFWAWILDLAAFLLTCLAWFGYRRVLNRTALWLLILTLLVHTLGLAARMYISGRPPVTNLYSSALFIGWAAMLFGIVLEMIYGLGIGNLIASVAGFGTLQIAHYLSGDGDTLIMMEAVLDTQFWLATHVVCVTLGYAATFVAGLLGIIYVAGAVISGTWSEKDRWLVGRMIYGTVCFAMFFSFFGTVLGGLWADDSWGRFWGWDPKENGASIIVIWNALVLHARWGGMVKDRGLAVLAMAGNIVTSWSWFGVNELGAGLHSYGFTEGVAKALAIAILVQLGLIVLGLTPKRRWPLWGRTPTLTEA